LLTRGAWYLETASKLKMGGIHEEPKKIPEDWSVHFIDIDGLKFTNDNYGHENGDILLKTVAEAIKEIAKEHKGVAARYAGSASDEFVLYTPSKGIRETQELREEIRRLIKEKLINSPLAVPKKLIEKGRVGASIGTLSFTQETPPKKRFGSLWRMVSTPVNIILGRHVPGQPVDLFGVKDQFGSHHVYTHSEFLSRFREKYLGMTEYRVDGYIEEAVNLADKLSSREKKIKKVQRRM